ncbi:immunoglobulin G-binding protein A-like [Poeciliopsis prolifica]|uniref:immunoglobulin G-binding protein A-like n=1 Tax=Poeciliopsis prolifica TaxID=188132 RepID=UPI00241340E3|nr:immunoglobulin G-binding protein A-like [Poeciliopsis prolifica]
MEGRTDGQTEVRKDGEEESALIHKMVERMTEELTIPPKFSTTSKKRRRMCSKVLDKLSDMHSMSQLKNLLTTKDEQGQELWVMTERTRLRIQVAEKDFLHRMAGLFLIDRVRSSVIREGLRLEPLLLHKPVEVALASGQDASWSEGWKEERKEGRKDGRKEGKTDGWKEGRKEGRRDGRTEGRMEQRMEGRLDGWMEGKKEGRTDGSKERRKEGRREGRKEGRKKDRKDGRRDGRTEARMDGGMDGQRDGRTEGRKDGWMEGRKKGRTEGWTD